MDVESFGLMALRPRLRVSIRGKDASRRFAIAMHKQRIIGNRFFDKLLEEEQFRAVDDRVDAELERLHWCERLKRVAKQQYRGVSPLGHRHFLKRLEGQILRNTVGCETLLHHHDLISNLAEANKEITVRGGCMDFVAQFGQCRSRGVEPFGS